MSVLPFDVVGVIKGVLMTKLKPFVDTTNISLASSKATKMGFAVGTSAESTAATRKAITICF